MSKIMFVCNGVSNGGAERVVSILADKLAQCGNELYILAFLESDKAYKMNPQVKIIFAKINRYKMLKKFARIRSIRLAVTQNKIDTVIGFSHYNSMSAVIALVGVPVRIIASERNDPAQLSTKKFVSRLRNFVYRRCEALVCQTEDAKNYFPEYIQKKTVIILNPISEGLPFPYTGIREKRVVSFSRFEKQKNIPMVIDAFEKFHEEYSEYTLELYGDGHEKENIKNYINNKNMNDYVSVYPFVTDIHSRVLKANMFILASNYEGLSNSMIESVAIGLPTIVTDCPCGGARMVIEDGVNGLLIPVGDVQALYENMCFLVEHPEIAERISKNGFLLRDRLDCAAITAQWISLIESRECSGFRVLIG